MVSLVLVKADEGLQLPIYYISKALLLVKTHYLDMEKFALALITASRKLRPYFQAHAIEVLTKFSLKNSTLEAEHFRKTVKMGRGAE